ncbi:hypothetical protein Nekkels1_31 [Cellulophaga phage Nekkels_1]|uniref:Uncharacterized protein n=1 Tax=Cellulophaga phage Nekkels_1 TaxID=2745692 RepID=A0A8E4XXU3_9CAUD|nr:hypothetical protein M1M31_gp31 [Cellulophaga phage Nekkels_1]QQO97032.1 hypothetical protein Nekkels1_31 [Cellulophaga phage Nekkels_1]QQO97125.1 hypothetical protein Nekkels2_31 [Cellulophaga phage Nekkels_2]
MLIIMNDKKQIVENILIELNTRSGFDEWWWCIGDDVREEIKRDLINLLPEN